MRIFHLLLAASVCGMAAAFCANTAPPGADVEFRRDILPILENACVSCHGPRKQKAGVRLDSREELFREDLELVKPGRSDQSRLVAVVSGAAKLERNAKDHLLPEADVELIRIWIDHGAP